MNNFDRLPPATHRFVLLMPKVLAPARHFYWTHCKLQGRNKVVPYEVRCAFLQTTIPEAANLACPSAGASDAGFLQPFFQVVRRFYADSHQRFLVCRGRRRGWLVVEGVM